MRRVAGNVFLEHRVKLDIAAIVIPVAAFLVATGAASFDETLDMQRRGSLYATLASTAGALLGFVLAALAVLVALPSTERMEALREHPSWPRVPESFFRASRSLLAALVLCILGIPLDSGKDPWVLWETATAAVVTLALVRVTASVVALDQILAVARQPKPMRKPIDDP